MTEIERKFLVNDQIQTLLPTLEGVSIRQGYLLDSPDGKTVRVRTKGTKGFLTIKGPSEGISRTEFEYAIPHDEAEQLLNHFCAQVLSKVRYTTVHEGKTWEIDVFHGKLSGLIVAEIELEHENESFALPDWAAEEVSHDPAYYNVNLIKKLSE